jgi:hypothetical protein
MAPVQILMRHGTEILIARVLVQALADRLPADRVIESAYFLLDIFGWAHAASDIDFD